MNVSFKREPVAWVFAIKACLVVGVSYGLKMTNEQLALVVVAMEAIGGLIVRQNVYAPTDAQGNPVVTAGSSVTVTNESEHVPPVTVHADELAAHVEQGRLVSSDLAVGAGHLTGAPVDVDEAMREIDEYAHRK